MLTNSRGAYMRANGMPGPRSAALKGLNWHVQVDPLSLAITSLPPTLPVDAVFDDVDDVDDVDDLDDDPPHPASSMRATANDASHLKRFMDTLLRFGHWFAASPLFSPDPGGRSALQGHLGSS